MGAIAAILTKSGQAEPALIQRMLSAPQHYDGDRFSSTCGACALGVVNARDRTDSFLSADGPIMAVFTGKLDNATELAEAVTKLGFPPASSKPADILVAAFRAFRVDTPNHLRGPFAAAITDGSELWFFRDQVGWRPLLYRDDPHRLTVASEAKQIIAANGLSREPNLQQLEDLFYGRLVNNSPASLRGVDRVAQAFRYHGARNGSVTSTRYWEPRDFLERSRLKPSEVTEGFVEVFTQAITRSLTGEDVVSLSGGIDSSGVAGFAAPLFRQMTGRPLPALSTVYPNHPRVDETRFIEVNATELGMELHTFTPQAGSWDDLPRWMAVFDGPIPTLSLDEIHEYHTKARSLGFRNVLGGEIAEAAFNLNRHTLGHLVRRGRWRAAATLSRTMHAQGSTWSQIARFVLLPWVPPRLALWYAHKTRGDHPTRVPDWLDVKKANEVPYRRDLAVRGRERWNFMQVRPFGANTLTLEASEITALVSGTTNRSPFADVDVIQFFMGLPAEVKFPDLRSKTLVRRMLRGRVPDLILDRKDKTFFNDYAMSRISYGPLRKYLTAPAVRIAGVDYERLAARIERQDFTIIDRAWVNDLVRIHAFLSEW